MLCQFTFQNFKSYKNETTLDYQAAVLPEFKDTLITEASASDQCIFDVTQLQHNTSGVDRRK